MNDERIRDIEKVNKLSHNGGPCYIFWHEESGGEVHRIWDTLFLFSVAQYGGNTQYEGAFRLDEVEKLVDLAHTWT